MSRERVSSEKIGKFVALLKESRGRTVVLTGAGISTESGIPDFRSPGGLWSKFDPYEVASIDALRRNPKKVFDFLREMYRMCEGARPSKGHIYLSRLGKLGYIKAIITQNIDGLHKEANKVVGWDGEVVELHGSGRYATCITCGRRFSREEYVRMLFEMEVVKCPFCGGIIKPDVVFFGEMLDPSVLRRARELAANSKLFVVIGSSLMVYPAGNLPLIAKSSGAKLLIINLMETECDELADIKISGRAGEVLERVCTVVCSEAG